MSETQDKLKLCIEQLDIAITELVKCSTKLEEAYLNLRELKKEVTV